MEDWKDTRQVNYFDLKEYVNRIKLSPQVEEHLKYLEEEFQEYISLLGKYSAYDEYSILYYWLDANYKELENSCKMEKHKFSFGIKELLDGDLFFDAASINDEKIKKIHSFVCANSGATTSKVGEYRENEVWIGRYLPDGTKEVYWNGVQAQDILYFMKDFIAFYQNAHKNILYSYAFIKAALAHLLFVRIHPFGDGNGRTARIIQNICFTDNINKICHTNLKLSPLNISQNLYINQMTYVSRINHIRFDLENDYNEAINKYLDFMLNMYDEQLYYQSVRIPSLERSFENLKQLKENDEEEFLRKVKSSQIGKMF